MDSFLFSLLLVFALALGGRDQWLVARWADALGRRVSLLLVGVAAASCTAALMAWAGAGFADRLPPRAAQMLVAFALAIAGAELAWPVRLKEPREPTRSLGAIALVLAGRQVGDAARFAVFAFAAHAHWPVTAAIGGALGAGRRLFWAGLSGRRGWCACPCARFGWRWLCASFLQRYSSD